MASLQPTRIKTIGEYHQVMGLPKPEHPLVTLINFEQIKHLPGNGTMSAVFDFYSIALKRNFNGKMKYGQQQFDFDEGIMTFMAPNQVFGIELQNDQELKHTGWMLLVHPDFLWNTALAKKIKQYEFFDYSVNEALFLSDKEETKIIGMMKNIEQEYHSNIDQFSHDVIIAQMELLLTYAERFYHRQFLTRRITNHGILARLEELLTDYFKNDEVVDQGVPTVHFVAERLNVSPNYLSEMLRVLTGQSTQQHIHDKLIERAKERLSTTNLSVGEIAYELGFEHPQSFSKLFKSKMKVTPLQYRHSFN